MPIKVLTAVAICDGHDAAICAINRELVNHGIEVVYLGYHKTPRQIVRAAIEEDAQVIGISSYNGGHMEFFSEVLELVNEHDAADIAVIGGGGGTISPAEGDELESRGVAHIFRPGMPLTAIAKYVLENFDRVPHGKKECAITGKEPLKNRREVAQAITWVENKAAAEAEVRSIFSSLAESTLQQRPHGDVQLPPSLNEQVSSQTNFIDQVNSWLQNLSPPNDRSFVVGFTGSGGVGKSTLIDELVIRFLKARQDRVAVVCVDPTQWKTGGALLGDRTRFIHTNDDRVFVRSLATRGVSGGLASATSDVVRILSAAGYETIFVESVGIGQADDPFRDMDSTVVAVMTPEYGTSLQLQKMTVLDSADIVVLNKSDYPGAASASIEIEDRLRSTRPVSPIVETIASRHNDGGVDRLFDLLVGLAEKKDIAPNGNA